jgi:hypothetical protein
LKFCNFFDRNRWLSIFQSTISNQFSFNENSTFFKHITRFDDRFVIYRLQRIFWYLKLRNPTNICDSKSTCNSNPSLTLSARRNEEKCIDESALFIFAFISLIAVRMVIYCLENNFSWTSEDKNTISTNIFMFVHWKSCMKVESDRK